MSSGTPLTDQDREPWLHTITDWMTGQAEAGHSTVVTCSALKRKYRDILRQAKGRVVFLHLTGDYETISQRMKVREEHFMPESLLKSQFETLEEPADDEQAVPLDTTPDQRTVVDEAIRVASRYFA